MTYYDYNNTGGHECPHPGCPIPQDLTPIAPTWITCTCPTMLVVPAGQHMHHQCPLHGDTVIQGSQVWCQTDQNTHTSTGVSFYVEDGALKWKGSAGTITTMGTA